MKYYRSTATGKIMSENSLRVLNDIFGGDTVSSMMSDGLLENVENPTVIDCIRSGNMATAITRYREIHGCGLADAKKGVYAIRSDMARARSMNKKKQKKAAESAK